LIPTPIQRALATLREFEVPTLLIGGQACILYGGAEFSRDLDLMLAAAPAVLPRLEEALAALEADLIAVPALRSELLERGHAVHFRCRRPDVAGLRLDLMTRPPRLPDVEAIWRRRVILELDLGPTSVIALEDLIPTKKTQRDKDWATIGELVEADMVAHRANADADRAGFWLREGRNADALIELAGAFKESAAAAAVDRPLLNAARERERDTLELELAREQIRGKQADREYWAPLRAELEQMRHEHRRTASS
jgi:hypothetical protein